MSSLVNDNEEPPSDSIEHSTPSAPSKAAVLPLVYIQTQNNKLPFGSTKIPPLQFALNKNIQTARNSGVILAPVKNVGKSQQIVIAKPGNMVPVSPSKITGTYLTMIKPEVTQSTPGQKYVISPMPKVIKNRLPVTLTTNSLQPKIAFMPLTIPSSKQDLVNHKMFNIKISDGQVQQGTIIDEAPKTEKEYELSIAEDSKVEAIKQTPKYTKGISILKKQYHCSILNNNSSSVLDSEVKAQKTERRRKSNFSYRKDYDEILEKDSLECSDITLTKLRAGDCVDNNERERDFVEIQVIKEKQDVNMNEDRELKKILKWEEGIGSLPGSNLKFIINEFNLLEYVSKEEYGRMMEKKVKVKEKVEEDLRCIECGCYGLPSEFITSKFCSLDCQERGNNREVKEKEMRLKRKRKKVLLKRAESDRSCSDNENNTSNENSQDKSPYPWTCSKKGFSWSKYLDHMKAKAAPVKLFKDPFPYNRNGFRPGMKLEGIDPVHPSSFCVLTVSEICGYRVRLHFDGFPDNYDFWVNADSMDIFPAGWCEKHEKTLQPPLGYTVQNFSWLQYLKHTKATSAPKHLFANRTGNAICPNGFRVGMKLEAVDRRNNTSLVCVATVKDMMDNRILVHFDSWDDIYDYWVDPTSPYIHPVSWSDENGHSLTPPNDYRDPENFSWEKYLKETKSVAAPVRAFKQRPACGFKRGMRLECVDKRVPQLIRVATVDAVRDHQIRIQFDGWPDRYSYWVDDDCEDIHPIGWSHKTGHPLEPPLTPDDVYDFLECPTVGCRGLGHIQGPKFLNHSEQKYCPYAEDNIDVERVLPDRLLTPDRLIEAVVPIQREPSKPKTRLGRPPKSLKQEQNKTESDEEKKPKRRYRKRIKLESEDSKDKLEIVKQLLEDSRIEPAIKESWSTHSRFLNEYVLDARDIRRWNEGKTAEFVSNIEGCEHYSTRFSECEIDGEALLSLSQSDLIEILKLKIGPAIKLYNIVVLLRQKVGFKTF